MPDLELGTVLEEEREQLESLGQHKTERNHHKEVSPLYRIMLMVCPLSLCSIEERCDEAECFSARKRDVGGGTRLKMAGILSERKW